MDVRFYPAAAGDPSGLDFAQCLGYYSYNKFGNNNNYMNMAEANNAFLAANEQTFHTPSLGDEEFEIPPITPPPEAEPGLGMADVLLPFAGLGEQLPTPGSEFTPQFPPQSLDLPSITISRNLVEQDGGIHSNGLHMDQSHTQVSQYRQDHSLIMRSIVHMTDAAHSGMMPPAQLTTINQSQLSTQLGLNLGGTTLPHTSPSPPASKSATPSPSSSINEEDADESNRATGEKRAAPDSGKKPKTPKKKKKKDPNEPQKPVSAYALFFRDTQAAIKGQNPNATFGEVSKIVASMWDSLGEEQKQVAREFLLTCVSPAAAESAEAQTIRSVQQTLASTNLSSSLILNTSLSQHPGVSASPQTLQQSLPRAIAPKPLTMRLPMNQIVASVTVAPNMPTNIAAPLMSSMGSNMVPTPSSSQVSPSMQSQQHQMQQLQQQQMQQMQQQQLHQHQMHQQIQQQMQQQHFQHHMQQHLQQQQQHLQQQMSQQQMQLQHMQMQQQMQQQLQHMQHQSQPSPQQQHSPVASQITSPIPALGSPQPAPQQHQAQIQPQAQTQVLSQVSIF
uniref:TOX high mobility group box family member 3 n=1 Tax=Nothoprocta perdicaria TaxID=30464 RepID=A0A8C6YX76_NOTPE